MTALIHCEFFWGIQSSAFLQPDGIRLFLFPFFPSLAPFSPNFLLFAFLFLCLDVSCLIQ